MPSNHLILCHSLLLLPSIFPRIRVLFQMSQLFTSGGQSIGQGYLVLEEQITVITLTLDGAIRHSYVNLWEVEFNLKLEVEKIH